MRRFLALSLTLFILSSSFVGCSKKETKSNNTSLIDQASITKPSISKIIEETTEETVTPEPIIVTETINMYEEGKEPLVTYYDWLYEDEERNTESDNVMYSRLSDEAIYEFVPGSNNGYVIPYLGSVIAYKEVDYEEYMTRNKYGIVDTTGTIVCDPIYDKLDSTVFSNGYLTERHVNGQLYCGYISFDGSKKFEIPCGDDVYYYRDYDYGPIRFYNIETNKLVFYSRDGSYLYESLTIPTDLTSDEYIFWIGSYILSDNQYYCTINGKSIEFTNIGAIEGLYDDLIIYDYDEELESVYDPTMGNVIEGMHDIRVFGNNYLCKTTDNILEVYSEDGTCLNVLDYDDYLIVKSKIYCFDDSQENIVYIYNSNGELEKEVSTNTDILRSDSAYLSLTSSKFFCIECFYDDYYHTYLFDYDLNPIPDYIYLTDMNGDLYYVNDNNLVYFATGEVVGKLNEYYNTNIVNGHIIVSDYLEKRTEIYSLDGDLIFRFVAFDGKSISNEFEDFDVE